MTKCKYKQCADYHTAYKSNCANMEFITECSIRKMLMAKDRDIKKQSEMINALETELEHTKNILFRYAGYDDN